MNEQGKILARGHRFSQFGDTLICDLCEQHVDTGDQFDETVPLCPNRSDLFKDNRNNLVALRGTLRDTAAVKPPSLWSRIRWWRVALITIIFLAIGYAVCACTGMLYFTGVIR